MLFKRIFFIFVRLFAFLFFCLFAFLYFFVRLVLLCAFCAFSCFFVRVKSFRKKKKRFKSVLMTSFVLLLVISDLYSSKPSGPGCMYCRGDCEKLWTWTFMHESSGSSECWMVSTVFKNVEVSSTAIKYCLVFFL